MALAAKETPLAFMYDRGEQQVTLRRKTAVLSLMV